MNANIIADKSSSFAVRVVNLTRFLKKNKVEAILINQLLRSGTSIAANVHEASASFTRKEFSAKLSISLKEARETNYWLKLLFDSKTISEKEYKSISDDCNELEKILFVILRTVKNNPSNKNP
jgi:four helix bundle protein